MNEIKYGSIKDALIDAACRAHHQYAESMSSGESIGLPSQSSSFEFQRRSLTPHLEDDSNDSSEESGFSHYATDASIFLPSLTPSRISDAVSEASTVPFELVRELRSPPPTMQPIVVEAQQIGDDIPPVEVPLHSSPMNRPGTPHHMMYEPVSPGAYSPGPYRAHEVEDRERTSPRDNVGQPQQDNAWQQHVYVPQSPPPHEIERQQQQQPNDDLARILENPFIRLIEADRQRELNRIRNIEGVWPQPLNDVEASAVQMAQQMFFHLQIQSSRSMVLFDENPNMVTARVSREDWDAFRRYQDIPAERRNQLQHFNAFLEGLENGQHTQYLLDLAMGGPYNIFYRR